MNNFLKTILVSLLLFAAGVEFFTMTVDLLTLSEFDGFFRPFVFSFLPKITVSIGLLYLAYRIIKYKKKVTE